MTKESPIVINDREELIFMLSEAASLEHMIMCEYLFATFSLKRDVSEGVTAAQLEAIKRWERVVALVATQEMLHLSLVSNLLTAIGSNPFLHHPNFPQRSKYYPPGVQLDLLPFGEHALQHFLYLERPEGMDLEDAPEFTVPAIPKPSITLDDDQIVPQAQDFATIGHLYRGIEEGFRHLVEKYGEQRVFIGPPRAQATQQYFGWPELIAVTDLASACKAIETIIVEGEGARGDWRQAHFGKFMQVVQEYRDCKQQDPGFEPARPVVAAYARPPSDTSNVPLIADPVTADVSELFNASYEVLSQMLMRYFIHSDETDDELQALSSTAVNAMIMAIKPLGQLLSTLPIGPNLPGKVAGPAFEMYQTGYVLPHHDAAWIVLHERFLELDAICGRVSEEPSAPRADLQTIGENFRRMAGVLAPHVKASQPVTN
ncbi:MAG: ferritin-like domain-containing protein [Ktedonobacterales bacterium]